MKRIILIFLLVLLFWLRWVMIKSPLPETWTPESKVRFTATILEEPEYTDTHTIVRYGIWYIKMKGYAVIIPGSRISFVGSVTPKVLGNTVSQIVMVDPTFEVVESRSCVDSFRAGCVVIYLGYLRGTWVHILEKTLPEPMSSLAAGILLGVKSHVPPDFYQKLVSTGTLHVIAASGYNVGIVASVVMNLMISLVGRGVGIIFGILGIVAYVLISGASASVVRAGIMGSLTLIAYYFGRPAEARRLLWVTGVVMLLMDLLLLVDVGFQLSFVATVGLLYIEPWFRRIGMSNQVIVKNKKVADFLKDYLYPTLAATISTLPVILWHFQRISWVSPLVNMLVLPLVPLIMLLSGLVIGVGSLSMTLAQAVSYLLYGPVWIVIKIISFFG
jgi:ComEC/Rec2-related protein